MGEIVDVTACCRPGHLKACQNQKPVVAVEDRPVIKAQAMNGSAVNSAARQPQCDEGRLPQTPRAVL